MPRHPSSLLGGSATRLRVPPPVPSEHLVSNPDDPGISEETDKNGDGIVCLKDWTGPDPDPDIGFLVIDSTGRHSNLP